MRNEASGLCAAREQALWQLYGSKGPSEFQNDLRGGTYDILANVDFRGAQTSGNVKQLPIRFLFCDEVDDWPLEVGEKGNQQGDSLTLGEIRSSNFYNKKIVITSTPTTEATSRIHKRFLNSTQEHFYIPCPGCQHPQVLLFDRLNEETAALACEACKQSFPQSAWERQQQSGFWKPHAEHPTARGFWLNALYSPFLKWTELIAKKQEAEAQAKEGDERALKAFVNSRKCEIWYDRGGDRVKHDEIWQKRIVYQHAIPDNVVLLTGGVDCQGGDRQTKEGAKLKYSVYGWAPGRVGYLIEAGVIWKHLEEPAAWKEVDRLLYEREFEKSDGSKLQITRLFIDAGFLPDYVYEYAFRKQPRVFPIRGYGGNGRPIIKMSKQDKAKAPLVIVGVDTVKDLLQSKLRLEPEAPGSINFPKTEDGSAAAGADQDFFKEITAEYRVANFKNGFRFFTWEKAGKVDNDFLDALVYSVAALESAGGAEALKKLSEGSDRRVYKPKMGLIETGSMSVHPDFQPPPPRPAPAVPTNLGPLQAHLKPGFRRVGRFKLPGQN